MNAELEGLLLCCDAFKQASGGEARRLNSVYQACLDKVLERYPNLARRALQQMIDHAYRRWSRAQDKPPSIPPRA
jgi:DNA-binding FadR family transcriptional regulator